MKNFHATNSRANYKSFIFVQEQSCPAIFAKQNIMCYQDFYSIKSLLIYSKRVKKL